MARNTSVLLVTGLLALACGSPEPEEPTPEAMRLERLYRAEVTLEAAPNIVREEVLKTCNKWRHLDRPCDDTEARYDQLECWLEAGIPELQILLRRKIGPRARDLAVLLKQNLCMEGRRWRKIKSGPDF